MHRCTASSVISFITTIILLACSTVFGYVQSALAIQRNSQVDLLAKSEIFDCVDVVCDAECMTPPEGSKGMLPEEILKNESS